MPKKDKLKSQILKGLGSKALKRMKPLPLPPKVQAIINKKKMITKKRYLAK